MKLTRIFAGMAASVVAASCLALSASAVELKKDEKETTKFNLILITTDIPADDYDSDDNGDFALMGDKPVKVTNVTLSLGSETYHLDVAPFKSDQEYLTWNVVNSYATNFEGIVPSYIPGEGDTVSIDFTIETDAELVAISSHHFWWNTYEGDAVYCPNMSRLTVKLPPLPQANWQVRFGYTSNAERPVINTYINGGPQFTNIDLRAFKTFEDVDADPNLFRGPDDYCQGGSPENTLSNLGNNHRVVVGHFYANGEQDNYLTIEVVSNDDSSYLPLDYLEFVPVIQ